MLYTAAMMLSAALPGWALAVIIVLAALFVLAAAGVVFLLLCKPKPEGAKEANGSDFHFVKEDDAQQQVQEAAGEETRPKE